MQRRRKGVRAEEFAQVLVHEMQKERKGRRRMDEEIDFVPLPSPSDFNLSLYALPVDCVF